jgi:hypothetical protein
MYQIDYPLEICGISTQFLIYSVRIEIEIRLMIK